MDATRQTFEEFMRSASTAIPAWAFLVNLGLAALFCYILNVLYVRYGRSLSNRGTLAQNFVMVGVTIMLIITIVKSSLALSLGLVGALSIVRFRTAIKEPEELTYLFLTIAIGLGFGAGQRLITMLGAVAIFGIIILKGVVASPAQRSNLYLIVGDRGTSRITLDEITETLSESCTALNLMRFDESKDSVEAAYLVSFDDYKQLEAAGSALRAKADSITVSFVNNDGLS